MLINLSFDQAGNTPGSADGWTVVMTATAEEAAAFLPNGKAFESFDGGWFEGAYNLQLPDPARAFFGGDAIAETFDTRWDNDYYLFSIGGVQACDFSRKDENGQSLEVVGGVRYEDFGERWWDAGLVFVEGVSARTMETSDYSSTLILNGLPVWSSSVSVSDDLGVVPRAEIADGRSYSLFIRTDSGAGEIDFGDGLVGRARISYLAGGFRPSTLIDSGRDGDFAVGGYVFEQDGADHPANLSGMRAYPGDTEFSLSSPVLFSDIANQNGTPAPLTVGIPGQLLIDPGDGAYQIEVSTGSGWSQVGSSFLAIGAIELPADAKAVRIRTITPSTVTPSASLLWGSASTL